MRFSVVLFLLVVSSSLCAKQIYVSPSGSDSNSGASPEQALRSIAARTLVEETISLYLEPLPLGVDGESATYWASTIPVADRSLLTTVKQSASSTARTGRTLQICPNPFNARAIATLGFFPGDHSMLDPSPHSALAPLRIHDVQGRLVQQIEPSATDAPLSYPLDGGTLTSGVYFAVLRSGDRIITAKFMVLR